MAARHLASPSFIPDEVYQFEGAIRAQSMLPRSWHEYGAAAFGTESEDMRTFVAIDLPDPVLDELGRLQDSLSVGRLVPSENLHLTLAFLGEQSDGAVEEAHRALSTIRAGAFEMRLAGVGSFGKRSPKVIYADVPGCDGLIDLERRMTRSLRNAGLEFQKRRFRPHVTIARMPERQSRFDLVRLREDLEACAAFQGSQFEVTGFQLYRSTLSGKGALHEVLASYDLMDR